MVGRRPIDPAGFEAMYRRNADPWQTWTSGFEAHKRRTLVAACGTRLRARGLDLACGSGAISADLARLCLHLDALDSSAAAVEAARRDLARLPNVTVGQALLPAEMPRGPFDLIVASEIAYYLSRRDLDDLCRRIGAALAPGGRLVLLHHSVSFADAAQLPAAVHDVMRERLPGLDLARDDRHGRWRVTVLDRPR